MTEIWKPVKRYEGLYEVSNLGRLKTLRRPGTATKILNPAQDRYGYSIVILHKKGKLKHFKVHRLVLETFSPNPDPQKYTECNHKDENKSNNNIENLEWVTHKQNVNYGTRTQRANEKAQIVNRNNGLSKPIAQYDLKGNLIKIWASTKEAERNGFNHSAIINCALGRKYHKTYKNYVWKYI